MKKCPKNWDNCKVCKEVGICEYISGMSFKEHTSYINWNEFKTIILLMVIGYIVGGIIGLVLGFVISYHTAHFQGGTNFYTPGTPKIEYRDCPLGHKNCKETARRIW